MELSIWLTLALCFLVGVSLGLLGGGGTILTVPIFVYAGKMETDMAIAMSLIIVGLVSAIGSLRFLKPGFLNKRLVLFFTISGIPTAFFGAKFTARMNSDHLLLMFGLLMCLVSLILFIKSTKRTDSDQPFVCRPSALLSLATGAGIGFLTGFLGVGGGFLIVPAISVLMRCSLQTAVGTSLAIIAINSLSGFAGHLNDLNVNLGLLTSLFVVTLTGALIAAKVAVRLSSQFLQRAFALLIMAVGIFVVFQNLSA